MCCLAARTEAEILGSEGKWPSLALVLSAMQLLSGRLLEHPYSLNHTDTAPAELHRVNNGILENPKGK